MANALNPNLIMGAVGETVPLNDLASIYNNAMVYRKNKIGIESAEEEQRQNQALNEAYKASIGPDGQVNQSLLQQNLAQSGVGSKIPAVQKANQELAKQRADTLKTGAETGKTIQETLYNGLKQTDNTLAALLARPNVTDRDVYGEMARLVNTGAFNVQAQQSGKQPDEYAMELLSTMPRGNPEGLRQWLVQAGSRVADASERLKLSLPKYDEQDRGGVINQGTIDQMTGQRTDGMNIDKSLTPGEVQSAATARRGQDLNYNAQKQANDISREAAQSQVIEMPQGYGVINKGTAMARPVSMENGQPVLGKDSIVAKNAQIADRLQNMIPMARDLMGNATGSGIGAKADQVMAYFGQSTKGADNAAALETLSGWMTSNVPRFEGPQSNQDTETYKTMAGLVGDRTKPMSTRLRALDAVQGLMQQFSGQRVTPYQGPPGTAPATTIAPRPALPQGYTGPDRRGAAPAQGRPSLDSFFRG